MRATSLLKALFSSHTSVYKNFAHHYDMVYFGRIYEQDDDQRIVHATSQTAFRLLRRFLGAAPW